MDNNVKSLESMEQEESNSLRSGKKKRTTMSLTNLSVPAEEGNNPLNRRPIKETTESIPLKDHSDPEIIHFREPKPTENDSEKRVSVLNKFKSELEKNAIDHSVLKSNMDLLGEKALATKRISQLTEEEQHKLAKDQMISNAILDSRVPQIRAQKRGMLTSLNPASSLPMLAAQTVPPSPLTTPSTTKKTPSPLQISPEKSAEPETPPNVEKASFPKAASRMSMMGRAIRAMSMTNIKDIDASEPVSEIKKIDITTDPQYRRKRSSMMFVVNSPMSSSPRGSPRKSGKAFKEFIIDLIDVTGRDAYINENFPEELTFTDLFGAYHEKTLAHFIWSGRCYELAKVDTEWNDYLVEEKNQEAGKKPFEIEDIHFRILDIFQDKEIDRIQYHQQRVMNGKPNDLIDALIFPLYQNQTYLETFMASFRFFMPPTVLLHSLMEWYNVELEDKDNLENVQFFGKNRRLIQAKALKALVYWIKNYWQDFHDDPELRRQLVAYADLVSEYSFMDGQKMIQNIREQVMLM
jgi:hypothetical protein